MSVHTCTSTRRTVSNKRVLGLDYGDKSIGMAVSDPLGFTAQGLPTVFRDDEISLKRSLAVIREIVKEYGVGVIVLGYPKNMDGSEGGRCAKTLAFKERLLRNVKHAEIVLWDERLTTSAAGRYMDEAGMRRGERDKFVDQTAAVLILNGYLEYVNKQNP